MIVLKKLRDPIDADSYSETRQFPNFNRFIDDNKYSLPLITWYANIVRVYKIEDLKGIRLKNAKQIQEIRELARNSSEEKRQQLIDNIEAHICFQFNE